MEDIYLLAAAGTLFIMQLLCFLAKKVWVRLLPVLAVVALMVFCVVMYGLSGWTNWAYLILLMLLFGLLVAMGAAWLVFGVVCAVKKSSKGVQ